MSHNIYDFTATDTGSKLRVTFVNKSTGQKLVPFNGVYNATLLVKPEGGSVVPRNMAVLSGVNDGMSEYQFTGSELALGDLQTQAVVTRISNGDVVSELGIKTFKVGPRL
jgi:hypothetical protein